jgi:hypothetical protein
MPSTHSPDAIILEWLQQGDAEREEFDQQPPATPIRVRAAPSTPESSPSPIFSPNQQRHDTPGTPGTDWGDLLTLDRPSDKHTKDTFDRGSYYDHASQFECPSETSTEYDKPFQLRCQADIEAIKFLGERELLPIPCLQCVLLDMPCDYKMQGCSRCARKGDGHMCLAQRPAFWNEKEYQGHERMPGYTLLRLDEEDGLWGRKRVLEEEVCFVSAYDSRGS